MSDGEMPFLDHLEELRWRIIWSLASIVVAVALGFVIVLHFEIIARLQAPVLPYLHGRHLVATDMTDAFRLVMSAALWVGGVLAFPAVLYQAWLFLSPALYARERGMLVGALLGGMALFVLGSLFAYGVVLPLSLPFLFNIFGSTALEPMITADKYFGFVFSMVLTFGLAFELPVLVLLLSAIGLVTPALLRKLRRHAFVVIFAIGSILSPGDFSVSTVALTVPLYVLYEMSIVAAAIMVRNRKKGDEVLVVLLAPFLLISRARIRRAPLASQ